MTENGIQTTMPLAPAYSNGNSGFGFGDGNGIWLLLFFILILGGGWGNGWGNNGTTGTLEAYTQSNDFSNLERENDIIRQDICTNFATLNNTLNNSFANVVDGMHSGFANAELSAANRQQTLMGQIYDQNLRTVEQNCNMGRQVAEGFSTTNYNNANNTRDIVEAVSAEGRATRDMIIAQRIEDKDAQITALTTQLNNANLAASQAAQTNAIQAYVGSQFTMYNPRPVPAFTVPMPYQFGGGFGGGFNGGFPG